MEISSVNGVKNSLNVTKQENNEINSANIEPKKDGNKKIAMALAALAATAAAGVGVAVAAKKGKINLPKLENSVKNAADDIGKVVKDTTDDAAKAAKDVADDVSEPFCKQIDDEIVILKNKLEKCTDPLDRALIQRDIYNLRISKYMNIPSRVNGTMSSSDRKILENHIERLEKQAKDIVHDAFFQTHSPSKKLDRLKDHILEDIFNSYESGSINKTKFKGLVKQLEKYTGEKFYTLKDAIGWVLSNTNAI